MTKRCLHLLDLGYELDLKNKAGLTPIDVAQNGVMVETESFLRSWRARRVAGQLMVDMMGSQP